MTIPKVDPKLKLDDQIAFAIRKEDKEGFIAFCKHHSSDASNELRAYVLEVLKQEAIAKLPPYTNVVLTLHKEI